MSKQFTACERLSWNHAGKASHGNDAHSTARVSRIDAERVAKRLESYRAESAVVMMSDAAHRSMSRWKTMVASSGLSRSFRHTPMSSNAQDRLPASRDPHQYRLRINCRQRGGQQRFGHGRAISAVHDFVMVWSALVSPPPP